MKTLALKKSTSVFYRVIWLLPVAFALHISKEYFGNFPGWVSDVVGGSMDLPKFIFSNTAFMIVLFYDDRLGVGDQKQAFRDRTHRMGERQSILGFCVSRVDCSRL